MHVHRKGLREDIRVLIGAAAPRNGKLVLADPASKPVEAHVDALRLFRADGFLSKADGAFIIAPDDGRRLGMPEGGQDGALVAPDLGIGEKGGVFGFRNRRTHDGNTGGVAEHGAVDEGQVGGAEEVEAAGGTAGTRAVEVAGVGVDPKDHVGWLEDEGVGGVGLGVPEEAHGGAEGGLGGGGLMGSKEANSS